MRLNSLQVKNFKCLKEVTIPFHPLSVLIGENDAGKSSVLDILQIVFEGRAPEVDHYFRVSGHEPAEEIEVVVSLSPSGAAPASIEEYLAEDGDLHLRKSFSKGEQRTFVLGTTYVDERLLNSPSTRNTVAEIDSFASEAVIDIPQDGTKADKIEAIERFKAHAETKEDWREIQFREIANFLPRIERYQAIDYKRPESIVSNTLRTVYETVLYEQDGDGEPALVGPLTDVMNTAVDRMNERVSSLIDFAQRYVPGIGGIRFDPSIDFAAGYKGGDFRVDHGGGYRPLDNVGDGTKRRLFMAALDWDLEVIRREAEERALRPVIRGYDEPDTNLHYQAQRTMAKAIRRIVEASDGNVQAIVCTHSLAMLDMAPARQVSLLSRSPASGTSVEWIQTDGDPEVERFLTEIASELGVTNSMLFFERCYLLVEGYTEENALPILYKKLYGSSFIEDGIRIINLEGSGARQQLIKLLGLNRKDITVCILDSDTGLGDDLREAEYSADWEQQNLFLVGEQEFEDAFEDEVICRCLNSTWPRSDEREWSPDDIRTMRQDSLQNGAKFSNLLMSRIHMNAEAGPASKKPVFGTKLALTIERAEFPQVIVGAFERMREIALQ